MKKFLPFFLIVASAAAQQPQPILFDLTGSDVPTAGQLPVYSTTIENFTYEGINNVPTPWTTGSILFVDGAGKITQDNSNLFWNDSTNHLGIGTSTPGAPLTFDTSLGDRIQLYSGPGSARWGFGIQNWAFVMYMDPGNPGVGGFSWRQADGTGDPSDGPQVMHLGTDGVLSLSGRIGVLYTGTTQLLDLTNGVNTNLQFIIPAPGAGDLVSLIAPSTSTRLALGTTSTEYFSIIPGGNVGIGTTTPGSSLDVNGVIRTTNSGSLLGDINAGPAGVYSQNGSRLIRFNTNGGANDFLSDGASLVVNYSGGEDVGFFGSDPQTVFINGTLGVTYDGPFAAGSSIDQQIYVRAGSSQSINLFEAQATGGSAVFSINPTGGLYTTGSIILEGSTANANETTLAVTDPTADRTVTFQDASGTVAYLSDIPSTPTLDSGEYTTSAAATLNVSAVNFQQARYTRVGNTVSVYGTVSFDTSAAGSTILSLDLPIFSDLASPIDLAGVCNVTNVATPFPIVLQGDDSTDSVLLMLNAGSATSYVANYTYSYIVQ